MQKAPLITMKRKTPQMWGFSNFTGTFCTTKLPYGGEGGIRTRGGD
jgi:hypothetical protein